MYDLLARLDWPLVWAIVVADLIAVLIKSCFVSTIHNT